jgi:hypothetical protein
VLHDLDATLKTVLLRAKADIPGLLAIDDVQFATPDDKFAPNGALIDLFLLEVVENRELRDVRPMRDFDNGVYVMRAPPLRVDCTYLVTAWTADTGEAKAFHEHRLLGEAMLWLSRFGTLPAELLTGSIATSVYPPVLRIAHAREERQTGHFWSALGIPPRPSFCLTATIALDVQQTLDRIPPATSVALRVGVRSADGERIPQPDLATEPRLIVGRVLGVTTSAGTERHSLAHARVTVQQSGQSVESNADGEFVLGPLAPGTHHLLVTAAEFPDTGQDITVPRADDTQTHENYDVILTRP